MSATPDAGQGQQPVDCTPAGRTRKAGQAWQTQQDEQIEAWGELMGVPENDLVGLQAAVKRFKQSHCHADTAVETEPVPMH